MNRVLNIERLLHPATVAFIGGYAARNTLEKSRDFGFAGDCWYVNPDGRVIDGVSCVRSLSELPAPPDVAFIGVRAELTVDYVRELALMGAGAAICYAAGFSEMGGDGVKLQAALVEAAGEELVVLGPNCYGLLNCVDGLATWVGAVFAPREQKGVAIVSQSGALAETFTLAQRSLPISYAISVGNQAVCGIENFLAALVESSHVSVIGLYVEGLTNLELFASAANRALRLGIPIVAIKGGASAVGSRIALGHTASMTGADELYDALFDRLGIIRVSSATELAETAKFIAVAGVPQGMRLAAFACSGGDVITTADTAARLGLDLPGLSERQHQTLRRLLPAYATPNNPLDYTLGAWNQSDLQTRLFTTLATGEVDATTMIMECPPYEWDGPIGAGVNVALDALIAAVAASEKPGAMISQLPENQGADVRQRLIDGGVAPLQGHEDGMRAIANAGRYGNRRTTLLEALPYPGQRPGPALETVGARRLSEWEAKQTLSAIGVPIPHGVHTGCDEMESAAAGLRFPVVVKISSPDIAHKSELGAVRVGIETPEQAKQAAQEIEKATGGRQQFLVEEMITDIVAEMVVGIGNDPMFGPFMTLGAGGIWVELARDVRSILLPADVSQIRRHVEQLRVKTLLDGHRGKPAGDVDALVDVLQRLADYALQQREHLIELEINPLLVRPRPEGVMAVDALLAFAGPASS